jgi:S-adenosylmethionine-diacylglycerol 3-amino-3-carboxypropyl transferase
MRSRLENVRHDYLRYANCWEDADVLLAALKIDGNSTVLSIGSAGDNSFSMLAHSPKKVVAVDINRPQLHLIALKKAAFQTLDHAEFLAFLGFTESDKRMTYFDRILPVLSEDEQQFWQLRSAVIRQGVIHTGKFERYFDLFRKNVLPLVHSSQRITELFEEKSAAAQKNFYEQRWNNWRWKLLFRLFFSRFVMGRFGRDPAFLREVNIPVSDYIYNMAARHLSSVACRQNYFLRYMLSGSFGNQLPHYARRANYDLIKQNLNRLHLFHGFAQDATNQHGRFNRFNLSNIFEYMDLRTFADVSAQLIESGQHGARYAYWNLMVNRSMSATWIDTLRSEMAKAQQGDKGFFYRNFNLDVLV